MRLDTDDLAQTLGDLDDDELRRLTVHLRRLAFEVDDDPAATEATALAAFGVYAMVSSVAEDRAAFEAHARISLEANGHEVWVSHDPYVEGGGGGWWAYCHCLQTPDRRPHPDVPGFLGDGHYPTREAAAAVAADHAADHGGAWADFTQ